MNATGGNTKLYDTLCKVLDVLRAEAPASQSIYHPTSGNNDALIQARSRALLHLFLKARFGLISFSERERLVTDGPQDGGIDAYYIDQKTKQIFVLQSKFRASAGNFVSTNMTATDLLKMDVSRILKGEKRDEKGIAYNDRIVKGFQRAIQRLSDAASYTIRVVLLGNTGNFTKTQLDKLIEGYAVDQFPHDRAYRDLLFPIINGTYFTDPNLTIEINLANLKGDTHLDYDVRIGHLKSNVKLLFVPTREIGRIMQKYKNSILTFNPRSFLELKNNAVNQDIEASIRNVNSNEFALFNNGITIISDGTSISSDTAKQGTAQVVLRNPQLVNGGQTAYTLSRIYEQCSSKGDYKVFTGKEVLVKIITFVGPRKKATEHSHLKLVADISKASNWQTRVEESDRRSNDPIQLSLQKELFGKYGLFYERKRGEFADGLHYAYLSHRLVLNREKLVRVSLACGYRANQARSSIKKFFKEGVLSSVLNVTDAGKYAFGYEVLELLEHKRKTKPSVKGDRYHTKDFGQALRYGQYAVVAVCANVGMTKKMKELDAVNKVLSQWLKFEKWAKKQANNSSYRIGRSFDYVNYYKGSTVNADLERYPFVV
ncbi:MAG TPA: AIPR family protein [Terriglobales bacterium]|nr:AIPR family protein [Terriglobales bacterium]